MKKRKSSGMLLEPVDYWEKKLGINYKTEFVRYKKLCTKLTRKEVRRLDGVFYITYSDWEKKMVDTIKLLDRSELYEYIHFLNNLSRKSDNVINLTSGFLFPFLIGFLSPLLLELLRETYDIRNILVFIAVFILMGYFCQFIIKFFLDCGDDPMRRSFYTDIMYLAERQYKANKDS